MALTTLTEQHTSSRYSLRLIRTFKLNNICFKSPHRGNPHAYIKQPRPWIADLTLVFRAGGKRILTWNWAAFLDFYRWNKFLVYGPKSKVCARTSNGPGNLHEEGVRQVMWLLSRSSNKLWSTTKSVNGLCGLCLSSEKNLSGEVRRVWGRIAQAHSKNYRTEGDVSFITVGARVYY